MATAKELKDFGYSTFTIAAKLKMSHEDVCRELGIEVLPLVEQHRGGKGQGVSKEDVENFVSLYSTGLNTKAISEMTGWGQSTVQHHITAKLRKEGITPRTYKVTPAQLEGIADLRARGQSIATIAAVYGVSEPAIRRTLKRIHKEKLDVGWQAAEKAYRSEGMGDAFIAARKREHYLTTQKP